MSCGMAQGQRRPMAPASARRGIWAGAALKKRLDKTRDICYTVSLSLDYPPALRAGRRDGGAGWPMAEGETSDGEAGKSDKNAE